MARERERERQFTPFLLTLHLRQRSRIVRRRPEANESIVLALHKTALRRRIVVHNTTYSKRIHIAKASGPVLPISTAVLLVILTRQIVLEPVTRLRDSIVLWILRIVSAANGIAGHQRLIVLLATSQRVSIEDRSNIVRFAIVADVIGWRHVGQFRSIGCRMNPVTIERCRRFRSGRNRSRCVALDVIADVFNGTGLNEMLMMLMIVRLMIVE